MSKRTQCCWVAYPQTSDTVLRGSMRNLPIARSRRGNEGPGGRKGGSDCEVHRVCTTCAPADYCATDNTLRPETSGGLSKATGLLCEGPDMTDTEDDSETGAAIRGGPTAATMAEAIQYGQRMDEILNASLQLTDDMMTNQKANGGGPSGARKRYNQVKAQ